MDTRKAPRLCQLATGLVEERDKDVRTSEGKRIVLIFSEEKVRIAKRDSLL
ncbi:MAG: hypothetical protein SWE60_13715 [Thermodesulfobacteriota bacterium]|nr:hypothetical protein [Thermodesulfobacteriota bacterium]